MEQFDVVTVGDAILDTFLSLHNQSEFARFNKETGELCIRSGSKVMVDTADFTLGGNASNVAVGLRRLGFTTTLVAELGDDEFAAKITKKLQEEDICLDFIKVTKNAPSTFSVILNMLGDRTAFIRHVVREHQLSLDNCNTKWIYLTSLGKEWQTLYKDVIAYKTHPASGHDIKLAFNPGSAQIAEGPDGFVDVLAVTDILFVNREEAEIILHKKPVSPEKKETEENLLFRIQRMGPKMIVMTDGENGSYILNEKAELFYEKSARCTIVEKTGAGDAYASGFLGAILLGKRLEEAMRYGAANAASVLEHIGTQKGLLTHDTIIERMKKSYMPVEEH